MIETSGYEVLKKSEIKLNLKFEKLSNLFEIIGGGTPITTKQEYWGGEIPWLSVTDFRGDLKKVHSTEKKITKKGLNESSTKLLNTGSLIISARGTVGEIAMLGKDMAFNQSCYGLTTNCKFSNNFLYYLLKHNINILKQNTHGSIFDTITKETFEKIIVEVPENNYIAKKIANILSSLDDKIELNHKMNQTLEETAKAIFKEWFIDFGPVKAKAEGKIPFGMDEETAALFPDSFEESELGLIPKGWKICTLDSLSEILNGFAFKSDDYLPSGHFVLRTKNFNDFGYATRLKDDVFLSDEKAKEYESYLVQPFDIHLVMVAASIGKTSITPPCVLPALRNQNMWCFRDKANFPYRHTLNLIIPIISENLKGFSSGSARDFFRKGDFQKYKVVISPDVILEKAEGIFKFLYEMIASNMDQKIKLEKTRDILLPKLLSGEIEIKDIN